MLALLWGRGRVDIPQHFLYHIGDDDHDGDDDGDDDHDDENYVD